MLHLFETWAQWARSRRPQSMHVSSTADCSQLSYVSSRACGQTKEKTRSSNGGGSFAMNCSVGGGASELKCAKPRNWSRSKLVVDFFFLNHLIIIKFAGLKMNLFEIHEVKGGRRELKYSLLLKAGDNRERLGFPRRRIRTSISKLTVRV